MLEDVNNSDNENKLKENEIDSRNDSIKIESNQSINIQSINESKSSTNITTSNNVINSNYSNNMYISDEMKELLHHKAEISSWLNTIRNKIYDAETSYLEEPNSLGNLIRGWDVDGRTFPIRKGPLDEKDRLFSSSSYSVWLDMRSQHSNDIDKRASSLLSTKSDGYNNTVNKIHNKNKKMKRSLSTPLAANEDPWDQPGDY